ncbi:MAG TPA: NAD(P)-dependent oxidoreductase [Acidimicrobiales bacterium]|nr:NAD(P)-dependent oxidoreductase [Acidimicrobiales bacterium]
MADAVLVTGAAGFVGRHVVAELGRRGIEHRLAAHRWSSPAELQRLVGDAAPVSGCIHLGWYANPADYLVAVEPNALSLADTLALAGLLDDAGCEKLVVAGSSAEYASSPEPVDEDAVVRPTTVYGSAKALCHELLRTRHRPVHTRVAWARIFNVIGPGEPAGRILPTVARALLAGEPVDLTAGTQVRDYIDVRDVATALVDLALADVEGAVNVSTGTPRTLRSALEGLARHAGDASSLRFGARETGAGENMYLVGRNDRLRGIGWQPSFEFEQTLLDVIAWWRSEGGRASAPHGALGPQETR